MTNEEKQQLAQEFLSLLAKPDEGLLRGIVTDDVVWAFPGAASISGEARGVAGVLQRAKTIAAHDVHVEIVRPVYGFAGVAMILHNTGAHAGRLLDEQLAAVFAFRGNKIARLDTYLSDVPMMEAYFA